ncbi:hypothetical protein Purlil1_12843 [Purpureocillium lilacinum]|uniref:F-box domain-containing protein n=1 Tax=Purpureocillium lilacinum TaxID=33203 RepID=A0ABR0BFP9_PURLI|nr:hypothetical protein Purlil1_12843 [Purpureocillium lilacinum]
MPPLSKLPYDVLRPVMKYLSPFLLHKVVEARSKYYRYPWACIFENESWLDEVCEIEDSSGLTPVPCLLGKDLRKITNGKTESTYICLLVNDWTGDCQFIKKKFLNSLRPYEKIEGKNEIRLKDTGITVNVEDIIGPADEWLQIAPPSQLFKRARGGASTYVTYYGPKNRIEYLGPKVIGGVEGVTRKKNKAISEACTIKLRFRGGQSCLRIFESPAVKPRVEYIRENNGNVMGFKLANK